MKKITSSKLQDIEAWIKIVQAEKNKGKLYFWTNRLSVPFMWNKSTDQWLEILEFDKKQEIERMAFESKNQRKWKHTKKTK